MTKKHDQGIEGDDGDCIMEPRDEKELTINIPIDKHNDIKGVIQLIKYNAKQNRIRVTECFVTPKKIDDKKFHSLRIIARTFPGWSTKKDLEKFSEISSDLVDEIGYGPMINSTGQAYNHGVFISFSDAWRIAVVFFSAYLIFKLLLIGELIFYLGAALFVMYLLITFFVRGENIIEDYLTEK